LEVSVDLKGENHFIFGYRVKNKSNKKPEVYISPLDLKIKRRIPQKFKGIRVYNYSYVFNFMLNCVTLDEKLSNILTESVKSGKKLKYIYGEWFNNFFNYGNFRYNDLSFFDYCRVVFILIPKYYNTYIYNLYR
jgi:hypothetical protein